MYHLKEYNEKIEHHFCIMPAKRHNLKLVMRRHRQTKIKEHLQNTYPAIFKCVKVMKNQRKTERKLFRTRVH
jgi:uncharacterized protein Veg